VKFPKIKWDKNQNLIYMSTYNIYQTSGTEMKDPLVRQFVEPFADVIKASVFQAILHHSQNKPMKYEKLQVGQKKVKQYSCVGEVISQLLATKKIDQRSFIRYNNFRTLLSRDPISLSRLKNINVKSTKYVLNQLDFKKDFGNYINDDTIIKLKDIFGVYIDGENGSTPPAATMLTLNLQKVHCIDETGTSFEENFGKDEINLGGVTVDDKQEQNTIDEFYVDSFNDGGSKTYDTPLVLASFPLDSLYPKSFSAFISIAEKDEGGFADFLQKLYDAIKAEITLIFAAIGAAAGAKIGAAIGGSIGTTLAGPIGTVIGIVCGVILGLLIGWLINALKDDIFEPQINVLNLFSGLPFTGPTQSITYKDHNGKYAVDLFWAAS
jgi:hypothetical protein